MTERVGRNDPCPCGSGKKYKKCCELRLNQHKKINASILSSSSTKAGGLLGRASQISANFFSKSVDSSSTKTEEASARDENQANNSKEEEQG